MWRCNASLHCHIKEKEKVSCTLSRARPCYYFMTKSPSKIKVLSLLHLCSHNEGSLFTKPEKRYRHAGNCFVSLHIQHETVTSSCEIRLHIVCLKVSLLWPLKKTIRGNWTEICCICQWGKEQIIQTGHIVKQGKLWKQITVHWWDKIPFWNSLYMLVCLMNCLISDDLQSGQLLTA